MTNRLKGENFNSPIMMSVCNASTRLCNLINNLNCFWLAWNLAHFFLFGVCLIIFLLNRKIGQCLSHSNKFEKNALFNVSQINFKKNVNAFLILIFSWSHLILSLIKIIQFDLDDCFNQCVETCWSNNYVIFFFNYFLTNFYSLK